MTSAATEHVTATKLAARLAQGETSAVELVEQALARSEDADLRHVFIKITRDQARAEAEASDLRRAQGAALSAWDGIPIAWKDLFDLSGVVTTAGSKVFAENAPADENADVVAACRDQGLIALGKTNLSEFAYSGLGLNPHFGTPKNPYSEKTPRVPGGSSSGSAVAVAGGIVPVAVGTDTAGSVRIPASFCGLFGFKASQNRYPKRGCFALSTSLDSFGGFAQCVGDLIHLDAAMRGMTASQVDTPELKDCSFVIPGTVVFDDVDSEVLQVFEDMVRRLEKAGASITHRPFDIFSEVVRLFRKHGTLTAAEAATIHQDLLASDRADQMDQRVRERMLMSQRYTVSDYIQLQWARQRLQDAVKRELGGAVLLFPTVAIAAPEIARLERSVEDFTRTNLLVLRNTMLGSYLGTPGMNLPIGTTSEGLPVGALISAPFGDDNRILSIAASVEKAILDMA